jgi:hypothetical protein
MEKNKNAHGKCVSVVRTSWLSLFWVLGVLLMMEFDYVDEPYVRRCQ